MKEIKGLIIKKEEYKSQAFADDMAFILDDPLETGPILIHEIEKFGDIAGLKINKIKTKMIVKNMTLKQETSLENILNIKIAKKIKYLGLWISAKCSTIQKDNYDELKQKISKNLDKWSNLQLSLMGKIATIKTNILPKLLFLFQVAPIKINKNYFTELNRQFRKFIWAKKKARIKTKLLQDHRTRGGFGLPNLELYYKAVVLNWIKEWIYLKNTRLLTLEGFDLHLGWHAYLGPTYSTTSQHFKQHYVRRSLINIWKQIQKHYYPQTPKWLSPIEAVTYPNVLDHGKIVTYKQILDDQHNLLSNQALAERGIRLDWWSYLQINFKYKEDKNKYGFQNDNTLDKILLGPRDKTISKFYNFLLTEEMVEEQVKETMIAWAQNFGYSIKLAEWEKIWNINYKQMLSIPYKENLYKMFYRWHLPPARLNKMYPNLSPKCWKCRSEIGTYYHQWWKCPVAKKYWKIVQKLLEQVTSQTIKLRPELFLLGIVRQKFSKEDRHLILHITTAARLLYAQSWKTDTTPTVLAIIIKILECAEMSKMTLELQDKDDSEYYKAWEKWYNWLRRKKFIKLLRT